MVNIKTVDWKTLSSWMENKMPVTILDIRPQNEREEWYIPESIHLNVYEALKSGNKRVLDDFESDPNFPIVTVCARGKMSMQAAEILTEKGFDTYSLDGGMVAWNSAYDSKEIDFNSFKIVQIRRIAKGCLSYIIGSNGEALVIDSALDPIIYQEIATKENWKIKMVTDTHIHADYISRTIELAKNTSSIHLFNAFAQTSYPFHPVYDDESISLGDISIRVLFTPGHTVESTCFLISNKALITGDTLFIDGVGRPDLKADNEQLLAKTKMLHQSLQKLMHLEDEVLVMPAHTSKPIFVGEVFITNNLRDIKENISSLQLHESEFIDAITSKIPPPPPNYITISEINKSGSYEVADRASFEAGANRCGIS